MTHYKDDYLSYMDLTRTEQDLHNVMVIQAMRWLQAKYPDPTIEVRFSDHFPARFFNQIVRHSGPTRLGVPR
jgi:hypothetical protein